MSAPIVTEKVVEAINEDKYNAIILNFANPDMVGHTGSLPAAIKAVETIDECVQKVVDAMLAHNGTILITADHGNCLVFHSLIKSQVFRLRFQIHFRIFYGSIR